MKSKKLMGLVLAGAIFVGATGYGSYAWFTDKAVTDANLTIAMGNLDIELVEAEEDSQWHIATPTESFDVAFSPTNSYANLRPGDVFTRTVKIENMGTLEADLTIATSDLTAVILPGTTVPFGEVFELSPVSKKEKLLPGKTTEIIISFAVKTSMDNRFNANNGSEKLHEFDLGQLVLDKLLKDTKFITVTADQINKK